MESINGSLKRLGTDYVDLYQAHRYDYETPLEETFQAFADVVRQGKALYIGVSEWTAEQLREGHALAKELGIQLISNQPQYSMLWRVIEGKVVPASEELGISQIVWSPMAQGVLSGQVPARPAGARGLARDRREERRATSSSASCDDDVLDGGAAAQAHRRAGGPHDAAARDRLGAAEPERRRRAGRGIASRAARRHGRRPRASTLDADTMAAIDEALGGVRRSPTPRTPTRSRRRRAAVT